MSTTQQFLSSETDLFSSMAAHWWDPAGPVQTLHQLNPLRLQWIEREAGPLHEKKILDLGCGGGILTESLASKGAQLTGIDASTALIQTAKRHAALQPDQVHIRSIRYVASTLEAWSPDEPESFDLIACMELLEHVADPGALIRHCAQRLKPGGKIFLSTLNRTPLSFLTTIVLGEYLFNLLPKGTHQYRSYLKPSELMETLYAEGLIPQKTQGVHYDPIRKTASFCDSIRINYMLWAQKPA